MPIRRQTDPEGLSKASTVFYGASALGSWATLAVDRGQYFQDLIVSGSTAYEDWPASARVNFGFPRTIGAVVEIDDTASGAIYTHGAGAFELRLDVSGGNLRAWNAGAVVGTLALPLTGTPATYVLAWVTRANVRATSFADVSQSWLLCYDVAADSLTRAGLFHAVKAHTNDRATWGGITPATVQVLWLAAAAQSASEILRDLGYYAPTPPASSAELEPPPLPVHQIPSAWNENAWYGPLPLWAAVHGRHAMRRHWSTLVSTVYAGEGEDVLRDGTGEGSSMYRLVPGSLGYRMGLHWLAPAPVPPGATHAWVRVHVASWVDAGLPVPFGVMVVSMNRRPDEPDAGPLVLRQRTSVIVANDEGGDWYVLGSVELAVGDDGWTYLCLAFQFDPANASANDGNAAASFQALHAVTCVVE